MPTSARKSSLGTRRIPQKYLPYNADDLQRGKRTGYAVGYVDRDSDEFEPFEKVIGQADLRTPPRPKVQRKKKRQPKTPVVEEEPEDGEMSMDLEESFQNSPASYFASTRITAVTSSAKRGASTSRSVPRPSNIDYENVPSPRAESSSTYSRRQSVATSRALSNLSRSTAAHDFDDIPNDDFDDSIMDHDGLPSEDEVDQRLNRSVQKQAGRARRPSFAPVRHMRQDEERGDEEDMDLDINHEEESAEVVNTYKRGKSNSRVVEEVSQEMGDEDIPDFAQGLDDFDVPPPEDEPVEEEMQEEEPEPEPAPEPPKKAGKGKKRQEENQPVKEERLSKKARVEDGGKSEGQKRGRPRKENVLREIVEDSNIDDNSSTRRGSRMRYKPLEWWRLEKVVYGRRDNGACLVPTIKEIRRVPKEESQPLGGKKRGRGRGRSRQQSTAEPEPPTIFNPEEGWDEETESNGVVLDYETNAEIEKRLTFTSKMVHPKVTSSGHFSFQKIFGDGDFIAAGQMVIPPNSQKPTKSTRDNTFIFYVIEGAVNFKVHRTSFVLATGAMFLVPRGNLYYIQNISDRDAKLFFAQARKINLVEEGLTEGSQSRSPSRARRSVTTSEPPPDKLPKAKSKKK